MTFVRLLERQCGVFTREQARGAGFSDYQIAHRLASGEWHCATPKVLLLTGSAADSWRADWVALLAGGPGAILAGCSAARRHDMEAPSPAPSVAVPPGRHVRVPGVRVLRDVVPDDDVRLLGGIPVTCRGRTVVDCLVALPQRQALDYLDRALQKRWITFDELTWRVQLRAGRRGTPQLVKLVRVAGGGAQFEAERRLVALLRRHRIRGWRCAFPVDGIGVLDVAFPLLRLAIEVDGLAWHTDVLRFQADRTKQNRLAAAGWTVLRFTWRDLVDRPEHVISLTRATMHRLAQAQDR